MSERQVADRFAAVPIFAGLTKRELTHLAQGTEIVPVPADATVVAQDDHGEGVFVILDGAAKVGTTEPSRLAILGGAEFRVALRQSPRMAERLLASLARRARDEGWREHAQASPRPVGPHPGAYRDGHG